MFLIIALCLVFPCFSFLTACSKKSKATETGFIVFYDNEEVVSNSSTPLSVVKEANYDINNHLRVYVTYNDGSKVKLSLKNQNKDGYEISHNIPNFNEIVLGTEYLVEVSYGEYEKFVVKLAFCKRLLNTPVLSVDDEAETLSWNAVQDATSYLYRIKKNGDADFGEEIETTETSIHLIWGCVVQVRAITTHVDFGSSAWVSMQSAWKPTRQVVGEIQITNNGLTFELLEGGNPAEYKPTIVRDEEKIELVFDDGAYNFVENGATEAGVYTIRYRLKNTNKYCWADGFTNEKTTLWTIQSKAISVPRVTSISDNGDGSYAVVGEDIVSDYYTYEISELEEGYKIKFILVNKTSTYWTNTEQYWQSGTDDIEFVVTE